MNQLLMSPFRGRTPRDRPASAGDTRRHQLPSGEKPCPRHPRWWIEKKVFFTTKTRECPYCELESYAPPDPTNPEAPPPCEAGFGGFAPPERKRRPGTVRAGSGAGGTWDQTPRAAGRGGTPRSGGGRGGNPGRAGGGKTPRGGVAGQGTPIGGVVVTPRHGFVGGAPTPRSATVRRTAVFKPTQAHGSTDPDGRPPRGGPGAPSPHTARSSGTPRTRHHRRTSSGSSSKSSARSPGRSSSHKRRGSGDRASPRVEKPSSSGRSRRSASRDDAPPDEAPLPPPRPAVEPTPKGMAKSLMFTSAARRRGSGSLGSGSGSAAGGGGAEGGAGTPTSSIASGLSPRSVLAPAPPSPSGSMLSDFSARGGGGGGAGSSYGGAAAKSLEAVAETTTPTQGKGQAQQGQSASGSVVALTLPGSLSPLRSGTQQHPAPLSPISAARGALPPSESAPRVAVSAGNRGGRDASVAGRESSSSSSTAAAGVPNGNAGPLPEAVLAAAKRAEPLHAREVALPPTMAMVKLASVVEALRPERVVTLGGGCGGGEGGVIGEAAVAARAVMEARELTSGGGEEEVEAAGAVLVEACLAVETLAQIANALMWGGKDPTDLGSSPFYHERYRAAAGAVVEASVRAELLLGMLAAGAKGPREAAASQRLWLSVLDRHEAWMRRRDSRKGLLTADQDIRAGAVTVFEDCDLLPEGPMGVTYAAEYLGMTVSATILRHNSPNPTHASAVALHEAAAAELRSLASLVPPHPRLARTHGSELVTPLVPLRVVRGGDTGADSGESEPGVTAAVAAPALVLVGDLVEGGSLRNRIAAYAAAKASGGGVGAEEALGGMAAKGASGGGGSGGERDAGLDGVLRRRRVLADVAEGLAVLHERGLYHGALSAENVVVDANGRGKLSLFSLVETRKAVAASRARSDPAPEPIAGDRSADAPSAEASPSAASVPVSPPSVWTPPEGLVVGNDGMGEREAGVAADAYAFAMIAWEVLTCHQPWEGVPIDEVVRKVLGGGRPRLSFEPIDLEGCKGFSDTVRLLWAQDPDARPPLRDVARGLHVPEPRRLVRRGAELGGAGEGDEVFYDAEALSGDETSSSGGVEDYGVPAEGDVDRSEGLEASEGGTKPPSPRRAVPEDYSSVEELGVARDACAAATEENPSGAEGRLDARPAEENGAAAADGVTPPSLRELPSEDATLAIGASEDSAAASETNAGGAEDQLDAGRAEDNGRATAAAVAPPPLPTPSPHQQGGSAATPRGSGDEAGCPVSGGECGGIATPTGGGGGETLTVDSSAERDAAVALEGEGGEKPAGVALVGVASELLGASGFDLATTGERRAERAGEGSGNFDVDDARGATGAGSVAVVAAARLPVAAASGDAPRAKDLSWVEDHFVSEAAAGAVDDSDAVGGGSEAGEQAALRAGADEKESRAAKGAGYGIDAARSVGSSTRAVAENDAGRLRVDPEIGRAGAAKDLSWVEDHFVREATAGAVDVSDTVGGGSETGEQASLGSDPAGGIDSTTRAVVENDDERTCVDPATDRAGAALVPSPLAEVAATTAAAYDTFGLNFDAGHLTPAPPSSMAPKPVSEAPLVSPHAHRVIYPTPLLNSSPIGSADTDSPPRSDDLRREVQSAEHSRRRPRRADGSRILPPPPESAIAAAKASPTRRGTSAPDTREGGGDVEVSRAVPIEPIPAPSSRPPAAGTGLAPASTVTAEAAAAAAPLGGGGADRESLDEPRLLSMRTRRSAPATKASPSPDVLCSSKDSAMRESSATDPPPPPSVARAQAGAMLSPVENTAGPPLLAAPTGIAEPPSPPPSKQARIGAVGTSSAKGRAGVSLRGIASSFVRFGKKRKDGGGSGVTSFPIQESYH